MKFKLKRSNFLVALLLGVCGMSCNVINPHEQVPTYIHIDSFHFKQNIPQYGSGLYEVGQVWVYYNNSPVGSFDLPATFPVIAKGEGKLECAPGVVINGIQDNDGVYQFYTIDTFSFTAAPGGATITHEPITGYVPTAKVQPNTTGISFEGPIGRSRDFVKFSGDTSIIVVNSDTLTHDGNAGYIYFGNVGDSTEDSTTPAVKIPSGQPAYVELDYKCDVPLVIGMAATGNGLTTGAVYIAGYRPTNGQWRKAYVGLESFINQYPGGVYNICIKANLPSGQATGFVLLDNVKIVSY